MGPNAQMSLSKYFQDIKNQKLKILDHADHSNSTLPSGWKQKFPVVQGHNTLKPFQNPLKTTHNVISLIIYSKTGSM
jgi:hypothetical protein